MFSIAMAANAGNCRPYMLTTEAFMTTSSTPEDTIAECQRRVKECYALLESTIVPEYRQALSAMAEAWMKIAQSEETIQEKSTTTPDYMQVSSRPRRGSRL
jgi:hypothetical protein